MKQGMKVGKLIGLVVVLGFISYHINAQTEVSSDESLTDKQQNLISIAALTAKGDLQALKPFLDKGLDTGLTINQIKEAIVHVYAYCGFPRSIRGLQTFMEVVNERKAKGITDFLGATATPVNDERSKYERGREILEKLTGVPQNMPQTGYSAFAPEIERFLKEHLFADIFERDVLTYAERELVTVSVLASIGGVEPMLRSHLVICLNVGLTPDQLRQIPNVIRTTVGRKEGKMLLQLINQILG